MALYKKFGGRGLNIVIGTLLVLVVFAEGAAPAVDDGGVGGMRGGGWV